MGFKHFIGMGKNPPFRSSGDSAPSETVSATVKIAH